MAYGTDAELKPLGRFAPGTRREARVVASELELEIEGGAIEGRALVARFTLPPGCYATTLLAELCHPASGDLRREDG